jgi:hypothetical protein
MAGTYIEGVSKTLSGVYTLIKAAVQAVTFGARGIVAYPFTSNWGPINTLTDAGSSGDFSVTWNAEGTALTAAKIFKHAYLGKPQTVIGYRMATGSAAKGTVTLNDSEDAKSLELETWYESDRAFVAVVKDAVGGGKTIDILEAGIKLFSCTGSTVAALEALINNSGIVKVKSKGTLVPANTAGANFTGGSNGSSVTSTQYSAFLSALEADGRASAFSLDAVSDTSITDLAAAWVRRVREEGIYIAYVNGGPTGWDATPADANTASLAFNYRGIINVGNGVDGYVAAEMAIFVAARVASIALNRSLTDETIPYTLVNVKYTPGVRQTAKLAGTLIFVQNGSTVEIDEGVNTLTTPGADEVDEFGKIRISTTLDYIAGDLEVFGAEFKKSRSNTDAARQTYAATVEDSYLKPLATLEVIQPEYSFRPDPEYHGKDAVFHPGIDEAFFVAEIWPADSMEKIYHKFNIKF